MKETVMETSTTLSGAALLSCELDAACPNLDCDALTDELAPALNSGPDAAEFVAYYCGFRYFDKLNPNQPAE